VGPACGELICHGRFTVFFTSLFSWAALITVLSSALDLRRHRRERGEFCALVLVAVSGMIMMAGAGDLITVFIGIEIMSISVYVIVGFFVAEERSSEASMKYFFLGAFASGILLYGAALIYGTTGSTNMAEIAQAIFQSSVFADNVLVHRAAGVMPEPGTLVSANTLDPLLFIGIIMLLAGMAFKIALVPFHMWTPDAYTGAPMNSVGFMSTAVKAAGFAALIRILFIALGDPATRVQGMGWVQVLFYLALITIIVGNLIAIVQTSVKRMLAYSSIAHAGYALVGVVAAGFIGSNPGAGNAFEVGYLANGSVLFYLLTYTIMTLGAFGVLTYLSERGHEAENYEDFGGLGYQHPALAAMLAIFMVSIAGLPPTSGLVGQFHVFQTAIIAAHEAHHNGFILPHIPPALVRIPATSYSRLLHASPSP